MKQHKDERIRRAMEGLRFRDRDGSPLYLLTGGHLSRSVGPDWSAPENYVARIITAEEANTED